MNWLIFWTIGLFIYIFGICIIYSIFMLYKFSKYKQHNKPDKILMVLLWFIMIASAIFLFMTTSGLLQLL